MLAVAVFDFVSGFMFCVHALSRVHIRTCPTCRVLSKTRNKLTVKILSIEEEGDGSFSNLFCIRKRAPFHRRILDEPPPPVHATRAEGAAGSRLRLFVIFRQTGINQTGHRERRTDLLTLRNRRETCKIAPTIPTAPTFAFVTDVSTS